MQHDYAYESIMKQLIDINYPNEKTWPLRYKLLLALLTVFALYLLQFAFYEMIVRIGQ